MAKKTLNEQIDEYLSKKLEEDLTEEQIDRLDRKIEVMRKHARDE